MGTGQRECRSPLETQREACWRDLFHLAFWTSYWKVPEKKGMGPYADSRAEFVSCQTEDVNIYLHALIYMSNFKPRPQSKLELPQSRELHRDPTSFREGDTYSRHFIPVGSPIVVSPAWQSGY